MKKIHYLIILTLLFLHCKSEEADPLAADFKVQGSPLIALASVQFEDLSIGAKTWEWNFGNGQAYNGKNPPEQTFATEGSYSVSLTVTNGKGDSDTKTLSVAIGPCTLPVSIFSTSGLFQAGQNIVFNNQSILNSNALTKSYLWDFGNDSTSTLESPSFIYTNAGTYTITLTTTTPCGSHSVSKTLTIAAAPPPSACFSVSNDNCTAPCTVTFSNCSTNATSFQWNFGDGSTSTAASTNKTYETAGIYAIQLTATSVSGANSTTTQTINISGSNNDPGMKSIPANTFTMGCNSDIDPNCNSGEQPLHSLTMSAYQISETEVTQSQWQALMGNNPSLFSNCPLCPVERVSWYDAVVYCNRLSELKGFTPCYYTNTNYNTVYGKNANGTWGLPNSGTVVWKPNTDGYRLPTEAEWERAARDGVDDDIYSGGNNINLLAWYTSNSGNKTHQVKQKPVNGTPNYQLYDMCGNVHEWCYDWYGGYSIINPPNPSGPATGSIRVLRGGSWGNSPLRCRVADRVTMWPNERWDFIGFRIARTP